MQYRELELAGMDVEELLKRLMQNAALVSMFTKKFMADGNYQKLVDAVAQGDMQQAEYAAHTLKGMCGNLSLKALYELFNRQVALLRKGEHAQAVAMMEEITPAFENAMNHMRIWLEQQ